jgi:hypothetical protein
MLWRYAGQPTPADLTALDDFTDADTVSDYAREAICWAHESGVMQGKGDGLLDPQGFATRAEAAEMFRRHLLAQ